MSGLHENSTPSEPERDALTLAQLASGDSEGLRRLLQDYGGLLRSRLRKDFGNALDDSEIDEAMSTMVVKVWHTAARFDASKGTLRAWASVIAHNSARRILTSRRRGFMHPEPELDRFVRPGPISTPASERQRLLADLNRCIHLLPPLQRAVLQADLSTGSSAPADPLAKSLATTANSIYVSRQKGRESVRKAMRALGHFVDAARADTTPPTTATPSLESHSEQEG